ncbi:MAG: class I SAM-dependent methyltransferase [Chloroflexi bacterium]|nr:class I SAM-dependent methyltransferase [Chloroflexota bacterium]
MFKRVIHAEDAEGFSSVEAVREYAAHAEKSMLKYEAFFSELEKLGIGQGRLLDVGAGPGVLAAAVAARYPAAHITALELSDNMIAAGREYIAGKGMADRVMYVAGNAADVAALADLGPFDVVYSTFTLHHFADPQAVIRNLLPVVDAGGALFLYDLRRAWWLYWVPSRSGFCRSVRGAYTRRDVLALLDEMGLSGYSVRNVVPFLLSAVIKKP